MTGALVLQLGWSPPGICTACGQGRVPVSQPTGENGRRPAGGGTYRAQREPGAKDTNLGEAALRARTIIGYACACTPFTDHLERRGRSWNEHARDLVKGNRTQATGQANLAAAAVRAALGPVREYHLDGWTPPPTRPAVVLDPFCGTGTTVMVARALGRVGIGVDLRFDYCRAAVWRSFDPAQSAKTHARTWSDRQGSLLDLRGGGR